MKKKKKKKKKRRKNTKCMVRWMLVKEGFILSRKTLLIRDEK